MFLDLRSPSRAKEPGIVSRWILMNSMRAPQLCLVLAGTAVFACRPGPGPAAHEGYLDGSLGVQIFYRVVGHGPDTIVAIHGGPGGSMDNIAPDLERLGASHTVIYYDQVTVYPGRRLAVAALR